MLPGSSQMFGPFDACLPTNTRFFDRLMVRYRHQKLWAPEPDWRAVAMGGQLGAVPQMGFGVTQAPGEGCCAGGLD